MSNAALLDGVAERLGDMLLPDHVAEPLRPIFSGNDLIRHISVQFRVPSFKFRVPSSEFRVPSSEFRVRPRLAFCALRSHTKFKCQGDHGGCGANCRCCLPALAGFVSPHSMGPGESNKPQVANRFKIY